MHTKEAIDQRVSAFLAGDMFACYFDPTTTEGERAALAEAAERRADGSISQAIVLMKARTDTEHFQAIPADARLCFIRGRLQFPGKKSSAPFPSLLVYFGDAPQRFKETFDPAIGAVVQIIQPRRQSQ